MHATDVLIIGAGPIGIELAVALKRAGVDYLHLEAGQIGQTILWYPRQVRFFSSPERIGIAGIPLQTADQTKATREEYLAYLRSVVQHYELRINTHERVVDLRRDHDGFIVESLHGDDRQRYRARRVVLAIGDMHRPNRLHIAGENLPHVSHYFDEPHLYFQKKLLIVGGRNSAVEAAIRCFRAGAHVTLSYRRDSFDEKIIKYWLLPEIKWLIKKGGIHFLPGTQPVHITSTQVHLAKAPDSAAGQDAVVDADFVLLLTGYQMDSTLFKQVGANLAGINESPELDEATMESNIPGLYVAGTAAAGTQINFRLFIENCHSHVEKIAAAITGDPQAGVFQRTGMVGYGSGEMPES
jgi:thioredoxin reductase (NADPH)